MTRQVAVAAGGGSAAVTLAIKNAEAAYYRKSLATSDPAHSEKVCTTSRACGRDGRARNSDVRKQCVDFMKVRSKY
jgi:hypothetical protein